MIVKISIILFFCLFIFGLLMIFKIIKKELIPKIKIVNTFESLKKIVDTNQIQSKDVSYLYRKSNSLTSNDNIEIPLSYRMFIHNNYSKLDSLLDLGHEKIIFSVLNILSVSNLNKKEIKFLNEEFYFKKLITNENPKILKQICFLGFKNNALELTNASFNQGFNNDQFLEDKLNFIIERYEIDSSNKSYCSFIMGRWRNQTLYLIEESKDNRESTIQYNRFLKITKNILKSRKKIPEYITSSIDEVSLKIKPALEIEQYQKVYFEDIKNL
ncbi:hypothetical protein [Kordia sp.]|uniref:hypothetical protein n=1 Tax=Kordia sp. TaxID=1965332 RepID=UPI003D6B9938